MSAAWNSFEASMVSRFRLAFAHALPTAVARPPTSTAGRVPAYPKTPGGDDVEVSY
jgi:hypothetical protein